MAVTGRWDSHIQVAELVRDGVLDRDEVAAAIRDLGDRLDAAQRTVEAFRPFVELVGRGTHFHEADTRPRDARKALEEEGK